MPTEASGRFGIGRRTLGSLGGPIAMHAPPFHFVMGDEGPERCDPAADLGGVYSEACRDTMLVIPLLPTVTSESVAEAVRELDVDALIFLESIRSLAFRHLEDPSQDLDFTVAVASAGESVITLGDEEAAVELSEVRIARRDAWAQLPRDRHSALGPSIGRCLELKATWYGPSGRREIGWARPVEMYLPATIDREVDSFAKAAGRAPGLWSAVCIDPTGLAGVLSRLENASVRRLNETRLARDTPCG